MKTELRPNLECLRDPLYDALVILGGEMKYDKESGRWYYPSLDKDSLFAAIQGETRGQVAAKLFNNKETPLIIVTGGMETDPDGIRRTSRADVMSNVLTEKYGIPKESLVTLHTVGNTIGNVEGIEAYFRQNLHLKRIGVISSAPHLKRAFEFIKSKPFFQDNSMHFSLLPVETLLVRSGEITKSEISDLYQTSQMQNRISAELQGIRDFRRGAYSPRAY